MLRKLLKADINSVVNLVNKLQDVIVDMEKELKNDISKCEKSISDNNAYRMIMSTQSMLNIVYDVSVFTKFKNDLNVGDDLSIILDVFIFSIEKLMDEKDKLVMNIGGSNECLVSNNLKYNSIVNLFNFINENI